MSRKKKVAPKAATSSPRANAFNYTSVCCSAPAKKSPVERSATDRKENKYSESGLGHWRCTKCAKNCKVKRSRVKEGNNDGQPSTGTA